MPSVIDKLEHHVFRAPSDDQTRMHLQHRNDRETKNAWYWRRCEHGFGDPDCAWEFLGYGKPDVFYLQRDYLEIKVHR